MKLEDLSAGNPKGLDTSVQFNSKQNPSNLTVDGLVKGSNTAVQFTFTYDPSEFKCSLNDDQSAVVLGYNGKNDNPKPTIYTVDTGIDLRVALPGDVALVLNADNEVQNTGTTFTFTKSTGGGGRPHRPAGVPA